jgi:TPP-dependent pyruvate/acetoin dehydrogenase alpha subunit
VTSTDRDVYRWMALCRALDKALCAENSHWFPVVGEEATVVGSFVDLRPDDAAAPHYRDPFVVYLMRGAEMWRLAAQVLRRNAGYNKGRSVPFNGPANLGFVPWVAGDLGTTLGTATGAALAFQDEGSDRVCVVTFGDGTANRGDFHENVNLAACWKLPIVYVCQHNGWAISHAASTYLPAPVSARAAGYGIPGASIDGNDVEAVRHAVGEAVARARAGDGPTLIEAVCWREGGHWAGDPLSYRQDGRPGEMRDPVALYRDRLVGRGTVAPSELEAIDASVAVEVDDAIARAKAAPEAGLSELGLNEVYA